jgi:hypothetical protein
MMKKFYKFLFLFIFLILVAGPHAICQVSINTDGSSPDPSAMLEIKTNNKGLLLPRIDFNSRPSTPVAGLLIYVIANGPAGNGLYFFDGAGWSKISTLSYYMFQRVNGGVVFYIDPSGQHGLIASDIDQPSNYRYGDSTLDITGATGTSIGTGQQNTAAIVAADPTPEIAARICDTSTHAGLTGWFLPSVDEVDSMYVHRDTIGGFNPSGWYWSSSQQSAPAAWIVTFDHPIHNEGWTNKNSYLRVRCIRKF